LSGVSSLYVPYPSQDLDLQRLLTSLEQTLLADDVASAPGQTPWSGGQTVVTGLTTDLAQISLHMLVRLAWACWCVGVPFGPNEKASVVFSSLGKRSSLVLPNVTWKNHVTCARAEWVLYQECVLFTYLGHHPAPNADVSQITSSGEAHTYKRGTRVQLRSALREVSLRNLFCDVEFPFFTDQVRDNLANRRAHMLHLGGSGDGWLNSNPEVWRALTALRREPIDCIPIRSIATELVEAATHEELTSARVQGHAWARVQWFGAMRQDVARAHRTCVDLTTESNSLSVFQALLGLHLDTDAVAQWVLAPVLGDESKERDQPMTTTDAFEAYCKLHTQIEPKAGLDPESSAVHLSTAQHLGTDLWQKKTLDTLCYATPEFLNSLSHVNSTNNNNGKGPSRVNKDPTPSSPHPPPGLGELLAHWKTWTVPTPLGLTLAIQLRRLSDLHQVNFGFAAPIAGDSPVTTTAYSTTPSVVRSAVQRQASTQCPVFALSDPLPMHAWYSGTEAVTLSCAEVVRHSEAWRQRPAVQSLPPEFRPKAPSFRRDPMGPYRSPKRQKLTTSMEVCPTSRPTAAEQRFNSFFNQTEFPRLVREVCTNLVYALQQDLQSQDQALQAQRTFLRQCFEIAKSKAKHLGVASPQVQHHPLSKIHPSARPKCSLILACSCVALLRYSKQLPAGVVSFVHRETLLQTTTQAALRVCRTAVASTDCVRLVSETSRHLHVLGHQVFTGKAAQLCLALREVLQDGPVCLNTTNTSTSRTQKTTLSPPGHPLLLWLQGLWFAVGICSGTPHVGPWTKKENPSLINV
jgi:hypothetical protein